MKEIVNVSKNWAIGKKGSLLVTIPEDMKFFRETTKGKICIMGSTTLDSFPGGLPLKNRINVVLIDSDQKIKKEALLFAENEAAKGGTTRLIYVHSPEEAISFCSSYPTGDIYVIGGASVYRIMLPYCDTCLVTHNSIEDSNADTFFPDLLASGDWELTDESLEHEWNSIMFRFCTYKRKERNI